MGEAKLAFDYEIQNAGYWSTLKLITQRKVYDYQGNKTADAMAEYALGGHTKDSSGKVPEDKTIIDSFLKGAAGYLQRVDHVVAFLPSLLPIIFVTGFSFGFIAAYFAGVLSPRPQTKKNGAKASKSE